MTKAACSPAVSQEAGYYHDKLEALRDLFGTRDVVLQADALLVNGATYPIIDDVIILSERAQWTDVVRARLHQPSPPEAKSGKLFAESVQRSFGQEWTEYGAIQPEHRQEFEQYFDLVDLPALRQARVCDLGCGNGRWSWFMKEHCRELVLVDFSDAIFVARHNLRGAANCLFFMADLQRLPFAKDCCDFLFCLGVLHHLPTPCLDEVRRLRKLAPRLLIFLYYAFDNRPVYFRWLLSLVTFLRKGCSRIGDQGTRRILARLGALFLYKPFVALGALLSLVGQGHRVPLYEFYRNKSLKRIEQDVYDRFFTPIEQRVRREDVVALRDSFSQVTVGDRLPYWHFLCVR